jgi:DNA-binding NtrC family response regulator
MKTWTMAQSFVRPLRGGDEFERELACAARCDTPVLITCVDDAEDRAVAEAIHRRSSRAIAPFVTIDCGRRSEAALESQLFGCGDAAGVDAIRGGLELAHGGTVFLANIDELSPRLQAAMFEFLGSGEIRRAGESFVHRKVDVRVIASDASRLTARSGFTLNEDLFYRLNVIHLVAPMHRLEMLQAYRAHRTPLIPHHLSGSASGQMASALRFSR